MFTLDHTTSDIVVVVSLNYQYVHIRFSRERPCRWSMTWPIEMLIFCRIPYPWVSDGQLWAPEQRQAWNDWIWRRWKSITYLNFLKGFLFRIREYKTMVFMPYLSRVRRKEFSIEIRKICFLQNSLELHQPNMHIDYRVIPISVHILSLARIS